ncbi:hypothetical protein WN990_38725 [Kitasatospora purpeofusca]
MRAGRSSSETGRSANCASARRSRGDGDPAAVTCSGRLFAGHVLGD